MADARDRIEGWRCTSNRQRLYSALGYWTPAEARASMEGITMLKAA
jgi:hypothetical protein